MVRCRSNSTPGCVTEGKIAHRKRPTPNSENSLTTIDFPQSRQRGSRRKWDFARHSATTTDRFLSTRRTHATELRTRFAMHCRLPHCQSSVSTASCSAESPAPATTGGALCADAQFWRLRPTFYKMCHCVMPLPVNSNH